MLHHPPTVIFGGHGTQNIGHEETSSVHRRATYATVNKYCQDRQRDNQERRDRADIPRGEVSTMRVADTDVVPDRFVDPVEQSVLRRRIGREGA